MDANHSFEQEDRDTATNFYCAARKAGVRNIIYLDGLGHRDTTFSKDLRSRQEIGNILRSSGIDVIEFHASIVICSRSLSFELILAIVERLPVMIYPR